MYWILLVRGGFENPNFYTECMSSLTLLPTRNLIVFGIVSSNIDSKSQTFHQLQSFTSSLNSCLAWCPLCVNYVNIDVSKDSPTNECFFLLILTDLSRFLPQAFEWAKRGCSSCYERYNCVDKWKIAVDRRKIMFIKQPTRLTIFSVEQTSSSIATACNMPLTVHVPVNGAVFKYCAPRAMRR